MKILVLYIIFIILQSFAANAKDNSINMICREINKFNGNLKNQRYFYEYKKDKLFIDGSEYKVIYKLEISNTSISFSYEDVEFGGYEETLINRKTGNQVVKLFSDRQDKNPTLIYYKCEIF